MEHAFYTDVFMGLYVVVIGFMVWKIKQLDSRETITRSEVEHLIRDKTSTLEADFEKFEMKLDQLTTQIVQIGVTLARIDERMKRDG